jgi:hypothetical protein
MVSRLGDAICVAAITFACSSYSASSNGIEKEITPRPVASGPGIVGVASSYNPCRKDYRSGDIETASGERYDPTAWTAAVHILYLTDYVYSEDPPDGRPADTVRDSLKDVPVGTPVEEIKRASDAFGLDFNFMKAVAKIESDFDPKQRTGSYVGLFQLSNNEFAKYGSGDILNARDNAIAAAYKFATAATVFELNTHKKATISDLYLIHQQGTQGAEEHVNHPDSIAWKSMCATDEGKRKGEKWCKRAIWANTLPEIKHVWKTVENLTSGAFVKMWQRQVDRYYTRYSETATN